ncbi:porin family protein [Aureitalea marina]|uniref:Outer membrane protein beta-barrel domain-containing protein n=1 Tax=Aureitalea marina TaxID=930804 RepID=A0A2S7KNT0_9FLAO|nr:porin family protein [Aureitalea marina]PQB04286.1 hypothetical protein BST85_04760 [Aureitalea marina]
MKKQIVIVIAIALLPFTGMAQGLDLGIKAGLNFATLSDAAGLDNKTGFVGGVFLGAKFSEKLGIQADLLYSQQGAELDLGSFDLDYINIPAVIKYYPVKAFNIHFGPQFGFLVNDDTQVIVNEIINDFKVNDFDFSGVVGVGVNLPFGLRLEGRYIFGISEVPSGPVYNNSRNQTFQLSAGISLL